EEKAVRWIQNGAQPTDTARSLLRRTGILRKVHELKQLNKKSEQNA
ncbi:MAG: 30S ribosomal protein S16, partial [Firmicutes bacterium]|nr:30S ribosomal protein S16 [Bacillota bacterium]